MDHLPITQSRFERLGFAKVASVLASGSIVFASVEVPGLEQRIEDAPQRTQT